MRQTDRQIHYWAHMLDECKLDETDFSDVDSKSRPDLDSQAKPLQTALKVLGDDTYDEFVEDLNFLMKADADGKVKRLKDALIKQFNSGNVKIQYSPRENVDVSKFKATQNEVCISNSLKWALYKGDPKTQSENLFPADGVVKLGPPICAAAIGDQYYVIDGHHRWSQAYCFNPSAKIAAYVIRSDSFKEPDDILKFVQMEIFVHTADKKDTLPAAEGSGDKSNNLFEASDEEIKSVCIQYMDKSREEKSDSACSAQFLYQKLAGESADSSAAYEKKRDFIADCIVKNTKLLKRSARYPGQHDRAIMPQTGSDKTGVPDDHKGILKATDVQPLDLKESKTMKRYTKKQIEESIKYWKKQLKRIDESADKNYFTAHVYNIGWQPNEDGENPKDIFKTVDVEIEKKDISRLLSKIEDIIHDYCNTHSEDGGVDGFEYKITIESRGN